MPKVTELFIYPVKGFRPVEVKSATVHELGTTCQLSMVYSCQQAALLLHGFPCLFVIAWFLLHAGIPT